MTRSRSAAASLVLVCIFSASSALAAGSRHGAGAFVSRGHGHFVSHGRGGFFPHRPTVILIAPTPFLPFGYYGYASPPIGYQASPPVMYQAPPPIYQAPPPMYMPSSAYVPPSAYQPPMYYQPFDQSQPVADTPASAPRVVVYPTGRYELRGDGVTTPHTWAWVPNPPAGPPPSASAVAPGVPAAAPSPPPASQRVYRWTDERGVTTWTDRLDTVPTRFRAQAQAQP